MTRAALIAVAFCVAALSCSCQPRDIVVGTDSPDSGSPASPPDASPDRGGSNVDAQVSMPDTAPIAPLPDATPSPNLPVMCAGMTADCDGDAANGCEVNLTDNPSHCGSCDNACQNPDCACRAGALVVVCRPGRADCDGDARNGCEVDSNTSMQHCGRCGRLCHTMGHDAIAAVCMEGHCHITCEMHAFGQGDCDDNPENGCETNVWTNENCGACGTRCTCVQGVCQ